MQEHPHTTGVVPGVVPGAGWNRVDVLNDAALQEYKPSYWYGCRSAKRDPNESRARSVLYASSGCRLEKQSLYKCIRLSESRTIREARVCEPTPTSVMDGISMCECLGSSLVGSITSATSASATGIPSPSSSAVDSGGFFGVVSVEVEKHDRDQMARPAGCRPARCACARPSPRSRAEKGGANLACIHLS